MKWFQDYLKKMDKTKWLVWGLCGILLLVIAVPVENSSRKKQNEQLSETIQSTEAEALASYQEKLEDELAQTLKYVDGAGKVRVMITFQDQGTDIVEKDQTTSKNAAGESTQYQEATIYGEQDGKQPFVSRQELPAVEGILVIAQGAGNSAVKQDIMQAVQALFPLEAHKIKILKMKEDP